LPQGAAVLVGFAIIAFGLLVLAFIISRTLQFLAVAPTDLGTAVISASALVFVALIANFGAKIYERRQQIQQEQRAKKAEVYEEFMAFWFRLLTGEEAKEEDEQDSEDEAAKDNGASDEEKDKEPKNEEPSPEFQNEVEAYIRGFTHRFVTWGSEPFIRDYVVFKRKIIDGTDDRYLAFEKVLLEIRRDLGFSNKGLRRGDLLKVFLADPGVDALIAAGGQRGDSERPQGETGEETLGGLT
jgi:hypothetical protein